MSVKSQSPCNNRRNQKTQDGKNERLSISTWQNNVRFFGTPYQTYFQTRSLRGRKLFNCDLQQWHSAKCLLLFVFHICLSVCRFVKGNVYRIAHCCVLSIVKKRSFLTYCVFWLVFLNARTHLCFPLFLTTGGDNSERKKIASFVNFEAFHRVYDSVSALSECTDFFDFFLRDLGGEELVDGWGEGGGGGESEGRGWVSYVEREKNKTLLVPALTAMAHISRMMAKMGWQEEEWSNFIPLRASLQIEGLSKLKV